MPGKLNENKPNGEYLECYIKNKPNGEMQERKWLLQTQSLLEKH